MTEAGHVDDEGLTIGEFAARTGVSAMTLRSWEKRHGAPAPRRGPGGHRRYTIEDIALVEEILRHREAGIGIAAAIEAARRHEDHGPAASLFAALRTRHPELRVQMLTKATMLALSRAIEDESCARADRPILFGLFQRAHFYEASQSRWQELARTAEAAFVFADFAIEPTSTPPTDRTHPPRPRRPQPHLVPLDDDALLLREWAIVCEAADHPSCLVGVERLDDRSSDRPIRRFEAIWSADPVVVRDAARFTLALAVGTWPDIIGRLEPRLMTPAPAASADLQRATGLLDRTIGYLDA